MNIIFVLVSVLGVVFVQSPLTSAILGRFRRDGEKMCVKCHNSAECSLSSKMDCTKDKLGDLPFKENEKALYDMFLAAAPDVNDPTKYTHCLTVQFNGTSEIRGCVPNPVLEKEFCDELKVLSPMSNVTLCNVCPMDAIPCNNQSIHKPEKQEISGAIDHFYRPTIYCWLFAAVLFKIVL